MNKVLYIFICFVLLIFYGCQKLKDEIAEIAAPRDSKTISGTVKQDDKVQNKLKFVDVYLINNTICIPSAFPQGTAVTLLEKGKSNVLQALTGEKFDYDDEVNGPDSCAKTDLDPFSDHVRKLFDRCRAKPYRQL